MPMPPLQEIRIAVFGAKGAGKTTLLASYFGNQQRAEFSKDRDYHLSAEDTAQGNLLLRNYYLLEEGTFPESTSTFEEYKFSFFVGDLSEPSLRITWLDYPGGWWERTPKDEDEKAERHRALLALMTSHVGLFLLDGERYVTQGRSYFRQALDQFRNEVKKIRRHEVQLGKAIEGIPDCWIIAVSKADLLPEDTTAADIAKKLIKEATEPLNGLAAAFGSDATFGTEFLLLSSASATDTTVNDASVTMGLELIAPIALVSSLQKVHQKLPQGRPAGTVANIFEFLRGVIGLVDKLDDFLPKKYQVLTLILKALRVDEGLEKGVHHFRGEQRKAASKGNALEAGIQAMKAELASPAAQRAYFRTQNQPKKP